MKDNYTRVLLVLTFLLVLLCNTSKGATITSITLLGDWDDPATWSGGVVPTNGDDVIIDAPITLTGPTDNLASLTLLSGTQLIASNSAAVLNLSGNLTVNGTARLRLGSAELNLFGNCTVSGTGAIEIDEINLGAFNLNLNFTSTNSLPRTISVFGGISRTSGSIINLSSETLNVIFLFRGASPSTVASGLSLPNVTISKTSTLSLTGGSTLTINGNLILTNSSDILAIGASTSLTLRGTITGSGFLSSVSTSTISFEGSGGNTNLRLLNSNAVGSLLINRASTITLVYSVNPGFFQINNNLTLVDGANLVMGNATLTVGNGAGNSFTANLNSTGSLSGSNSSNLTLDGNPTGATTIRFNQTGSNSILRNLILRTYNSGTISLENGLSIVDILTVGGTNTVFATGSNNLTLLSSSGSTAQVTTIPSGCSITGNVTVQRFINGGDRGFRSFSFPVHNGSNALSFSQLSDDVYVTGSAGAAGGFNTDAGTRNIDLIKTYNEAGTNAGNLYVSLSNLSNTIQTGRGFLYFYIGNKTNATSKYNLPYSIPESTVIDYLGVLNQQNIAVNLDFSSHANTSLDGLNLLGNPYASAIDLRLLTLSNISNTAYVYDRTFTNSFLSVNLTTGLDDNGNSANVIIPSGGAFFLRANSASSPQVTFTESSKSSQQGANTVLNRPIGLSRNLKADLIPQIGLHLKNSNTDLDRTRIYFDESGNEASDVYDNTKVLSGNFLLGSYSADNKVLSLNFTKQNTKTSIVPLFLRTTNGQYNLEVKDLKNIPKGYKLILRDKYLNSFVDIDENFSYQFAVNTTNSSSSSSRFEVIMSTLDKLDSLKNDDTGTLKVFPNPFDSGLSVSLQTSGNTIYDVNIYSLEGKKCLTIRNTYIKELLAFNTSELKSGIYILEIKESISGEVVVKEKIVKR
ncbi:T9SS type A sorting domain-containing protein [Pedobacter aquae]|uniref:T9SS type A sorting domain-containing protein n=1 Tax=Pedobacter aquae TaxID=2605747 RepID=A0A5C0VPW0_9SPHI|nr:T9SS type A sorting domain-containing protein [Pedobacter aquae]QEK52934.1 T9SS type A sorting domain-containing protein [Pedobacter aquae]